MSNIHVLEAEPLGANIVEALRSALEKAEAGELSSVAIAMVYRDGCTGALYSKPPPSIGLLLGSVTRLQWLLAESINQ